MADDVKYTEPGSGRTFGASDVGSVGERLAQFVIPPWQTRSDTYTGAANGTAINLTKMPCSRFAIQVIQSGGVSAWEVILEVSLDGTTFTPLIIHKNTVTTIGYTVSGSTNAPVLYGRSRCATRTGGTNVTAIIIAAP